MKVYLTKPRNHWISPYKILEKIFFWREIDYNEPVIKKWSDRLVPISESIQKILDVIHPEVKYVKIDHWDTWSMDYTLALMILPMLKQLRDTKQGSPGNLPEFQQTSNSAQYSFDFYEEGDNEAWEKGHQRWTGMLNEMIWAFEQIVDDNWEEQYWKVHPELDWDDMSEPFKEGETTRPVKWKVKGECDWEGMAKHRQRIRDALKMFGEYYEDLWD